jgi:hypothetical protein
MADDLEAKSGEKQARKRKKGHRDKDRQAKRHRIEEDGQVASRETNHANGRGPISTTPILPPDLGHGNDRSQELGTRLPAVQGTEQAGKEDGAPPGWAVSKPVGGRMADIDPILTDDEK